MHIRQLRCISLAYVIRDFFNSIKKKAMRKNYFYLILATIFWAGNFIFAKIGLQTLTPMELASGRFLVASVVLLALMTYSRKTFHWTDIKPRLPILVVSGIIGVFGYNIMMFIGLKQTSSVNGALIMGLNPAFTLILSMLFLSVKVSKFQIVGLVLSFIGVLFVITNGDMQDLMRLNYSKGDLLLIISSLTFGIFNVLNKKYLSGVNSLSITAFTTFPSAVLFLLFTLGGHEFSAGHFNSVNVFCILFMAVMGSVLAYVFWNSSVKEIGAEKSAIYINLVPFFTAILSVCIGQAIQANQLLGGVLIISGVVISNQLKK